MKKNFLLVAMLIMSAMFVLTGCAEKPTISDNDFAQLHPPEDGEQIVVIETSEGILKVRLFPEWAPLACENFLGLIEQSYYDDTIFHRILKDFMVQGGSPDGTGYGGESYFGQPFSMEVTQNLHHISGALSMARSLDPDSQTSQFFLVHSSGPSPKEKAELNHLLENLNEPVKEGESLTNGDFFPKPFLETYLEVGGSRHLDFQYTVFGQLFEGFDVLDKLAKSPVTANEAGENSLPVEEVKLISMTTEIYKKQ